MKTYEDAKISINNSLITCICAINGAINEVESSIPAPVGELCEALCDCYNDKELGAIFTGRAIGKYFKSTDCSEDFVQVTIQELLNEYRNIGQIFPKRT